MFHGVSFAKGLFGFRGNHEELRRNGEGADLGRGGASGFTPWRRALAVRRGAKRTSTSYQRTSVEGVYSQETVDVGKLSFAPRVAG